MKRTPLMMLAACATLHTVHTDVVWTVRRTSNLTGSHVICS